MKSVCRNNCLKYRGLNKSQVERAMGINYKTIIKYWDMTPEEYAELTKKAKNRTKKGDMYEKDILEWLREFSGISTAKIYDWLQERFSIPEKRNRKTTREMIIDISPSPCSVAAAS